MFNIKKSMACFLVLITTVFFSTILPAEMVFHFIDVGQGDSIFIETSCNYKILIDAGLPSRGGDTIVSYLNRLGVSKIDKVIASHQHYDHIGGMSRIYNNFEVDVTYDSGHDLNSSAAGTYRSLAQENSDFRVARAFDTLNIDCNDTTMTFIHPYDNAAGNVHYLNLVLHVQYKDFSALFMGDTETPAENSILGDQYTSSYLPGQLLKVGHHGSNTSTSQNFLDAVSPQVAVIQAGEGNQYGHPHQEVLDRLNAAGVQILRTDLDGTIVIVSDGFEYYISDPDDHILDNIIYEPLRDGSQPEGWTAVNIDFRTTADGYALFENTAAILTTPVLDLSGYENVKLQFDVAKFGTGTNGPLTVEISDDGGQTWNAQTFDSPIPDSGDIYLTSDPTEITATGENVLIRWTRANSPSGKRLRDIILTGDPIGPTAIPTFDPPGGLYFETQYVELSSETSDADILYTLDGSNPADPASEPAVFTLPIPISENTVIKAYAAAAGKDDSPVITMEYQFPVQLADINQLRDKADDGVIYQLTGEAIVTFRSIDPYKQWFIQDTTAGIIIDDPDDIILDPYRKGEGIINLTGVVASANNMLLFIPAADTGDVISYENTVEPAIFTVPDLGDQYQGMLITLKDMQFTGEYSHEADFNITSGLLYFEPRTSYTFKDGHNNEIALFTYCSEIDLIGEQIPEGIVHLTGIHGADEETMRIYPRSQDDLQEPTPIYDWYLY